MRSRPFALPFLLCAAMSALTVNGLQAQDKLPGDQMLADYFRAETALLSERSLADINSLEAWNAKRDEYRQQLREMLGLHPMPERTPLKPVITGTVEHDDFIVEKIQFQSLPQLYVTGNLYIPKGVTKPVPAILYVCGHGNNKANGVSYGSKTHYQHHPAWLAQNGYVCLIIDTLQLGEIEGLHHGTHRENMWWWNSRGYTPAGVEAWNGIRALDYLESRKEVDKERIGLTGRSGGGAYSWWVAALDERVKAAVPVAGITDLQNHVVDGVIKGHCDCMFMVNTYRWDFGQLAAMVAPRPLLIANTDKDPIFPLEGVTRVHAKARKIYQLHKADDKLGLLITEGGHEDTQDLQIPALRWFNRHLKGEKNTLIESAAKKYFDPAELKVFSTLPSDQKNTTIHNTFVPPAEAAPMPLTMSRWNGIREQWVTQLRDRSFRGWPTQSPALDVKRLFSAQRQGLTFTAYEYTSQNHVRLPFYVVHRNGLQQPKSVAVTALDEAGWTRWLATMRTGFEQELRQIAPGELPEADEGTFLERLQKLRLADEAYVYFAPRGIGPTQWTSDPRERIHIRRRFALLGQTLDGMRVWDVRRAVQAVRSLKGYEAATVGLQGQREMGVVALYASIFEPDIASVDLWEPPTSHQEGPEMLHVLRIFDIPQAMAVAAERTEVRIYQKDRTGWQYPQELTFKLGWDGKQFQIRSLVSSGGGPL